MKKIKTKSLVLCALFTALTAVGAFIRIPIPVLPFTLQTLFVILSGLLLGSKRGAVSSGLYMVIGLIGIPVFTAGGGIWYVLKPSFGYIIGFVVGSYIAGLIIEKSEKFSYKRSLTACFACLAAVYIIGLIYYYIICNYVINTPIAVWPLFLHCFLMVVPGDICLCFLAVVLHKRLSPVIKKFIA